MTMNDSYIGFQIKQTHNPFMAIINKQMDFLMISILRQKYIVDIIPNKILHVATHPHFKALRSSFMCVLR